MLGSCRWWLDEEDVPRENGTHPAHGRRRVCFDNMKHRNKEAKRDMKPGTETEAGAAGQRRRVRTFAGKSADCYGLLREVSRKFAQIRPVNPRLFGLLRVQTFFKP